jgi:hypothetical protein
MGETPVDIAWLTTRCKSLIEADSPRQTGTAWRVD